MFIKLTRKGARWEVVEVYCVVWCLSKFVTIIIITIIRKFNMNLLIQNGSTEDIICEKGGRSVNFISNLLPHPIFFTIDILLSRQKIFSAFCRFTACKFTT